MKIASLGCIGLLLLCGLIVIVGPIFTIWALNYLFHTDIPVNFYSWLSVMWLLVVLKANNSSDKS